MLAKQVAEKSSKLEELKKEVGQKNEEISALSEKISEMEVALRNLDRFQKQELETAKAFNDVVTYEKNLKASIEYLNGRLVVWKDAARKSMVGTNLGGVTLVDGTTLVDAVVLEVGDDSVRIDHQGRETKVPFGSLPIPIREKLVDESLALTKLQAAGQKP